MAAGIHHPNVVPILEVGASQSGYYLVMEYIEGETLARLLARAAASKERLPVPMVVRLALDMLSGLHAAHELRDESGALAGVVHRDVSPQNVLVGADGIARITDFGVARAASRLTATRVGQLKGKIAYMAPEQARGDEAMDRRADVFAAGVVIWEALAHRRLFKASSEAATLGRVLHDPVPQLRQAAPHIAQPICDVVMMALERDRDQRMASCAEFADALERAAASASVLGTARDLRFFMEQSLGQEIMNQREAVRGWTAHADSFVGGPPQLTPSSMMPSATTPGIETTLAEGQRFDGSRRRGRVWGVLAAVLLLALGGFLGYRAFAPAGPGALGTPAQEERDAPLDVNPDPPAPVEQEQPLPPPPAASASDPSPPGSTVTGSSGRRRVPRSASGSSSGLSDSW